MNCFTWNMQGANYKTEDKWNTCVARFIASGADIVFLQECGSLPASVNNLQNNFMGVNGLNCCQWLGTSTRPGVSIVFFNADPGAGRCNLALVIRAGVIIQHAYLLYGALAPHWRPIIGVQVGGASYFCIHSISPGGPDSRNLLVAASQVGTPWMVAGDFNREPDTLAPQAGQQWVVCPPRGNTFSVTRPVSRYDYVVAGQGNAVVGNVLTEIVFSDHYPVAYQL